jgi:uncharacterized RmlC-like cupin family protein
MIDDVRSTCQIVSAGVEFVGKHGYLCAPGISWESVGARAINLQIAIIPPGASAKAHKYGGHETALHILSGEAGIWYGERLEQHLIARAGDFLYIPPDMPHRPYNLSESEPCVAIILLRCMSALLPLADISLPGKCPLSEVTGHGACAAKCPLLPQSGHGWIISNMCF